LFLLTNTSIIQSLKERGIEAHLQKETGQVLIQRTIDGVDFPFFLKILPTGPFIQCVSFIPYELPEEVSLEFLSLLHFINRQIDLPGFGYDELSKYSFLRYNIPAFNNEIDGDTVKGILLRMEKLLELFAGFVLSVAQDPSSYSEAKNVLLKPQ
jgi:hypothetical protein